MAHNLHSGSGAVAQRHAARMSTVTPPAQHPPQRNGADAAVLTLDDCIARLDALEVAEVDTDGSLCVAATTASASMELRVRTLRVLLRLRDALCERLERRTAVGDRRAAARGGRSPPDRSSSSSNACQHSEACVWDDLVHATAVDGLRLTLLGAPALFPSISAEAAEVLWAAVEALRPRASTSPSASPPPRRGRESHISATASLALHVAAPPRRTGGPDTAAPLLRRATTVASTARGAATRLSRRRHHHSSRGGVDDDDDDDDGRWAYRVTPVRDDHTAPTVYDDLFPLPTAVSAFTDPATDAAARTRRHFYTGPPRRARPLV
ncbi:hypothetical protein NESM_000620300 [Novymonas esmeraldas]|uniref:Uncharacterized protein n=1 Tax=Novymonas esmeraldas TaxID=1808958 RepID=A0AAW0EUZ9_9TRYP